MPIRVSESGTTGGRGLGPRGRSVSLRSIRAPCSCGCREVMATRAPEMECPQDGPPTNIELATPRPPGRVSPGAVGPGSTRLRGARASGWALAGGGRGRGDRSRPLGVPPTSGTQALATLPPDPLACPRWSWLDRARKSGGVAAKGRCTGSVRTCPAGHTAFSQRLVKPREERRTYSVASSASRGKRHRPALE